MNNLIKLWQLYKNMGGGYLFYRLNYELKNRLGLIKSKFPTQPVVGEAISLTTWKNTSTKFYFNHRGEISIRKSKNSELEAKVRRILSGELQFFQAQWIDLGKDYDWVTNPITKYKYDATRHWTEIPDYSRRNGDIKYVWEKSRFSYLLTIIKYDHHFDKDHSEWVFSEIDSWIKHNPINQGPNWRCSQEISLRLMNWSCALHFYKNSDALTEERWAKYQHVIRWQLDHIYQNINFSRIAVRNNHAITETMMLAISEFLFPFIKDSIKWSRKGRKWFEQEIDYQIYEDGTYLQFSMNYHRVVIQLLTVALQLAELNEKPFSNSVYEKARKSLTFLYTCQSPGGFLPNYGANDGALFFPWSDDFRDYRPQMDALHRVVSGKKLYDREFEDACWWGWGKDKSEKKIVRKEGITAFGEGGYLVIRDKDTITFMRAGNHKDRPSQADNLHIDIWVGDNNVLHDAGSYSYNASEEDLKYFFGTKSHNTVSIADYDQMLKGERFIWYYWSLCETFEFAEKNDEYELDCSIKAFQYLDSSIRHRRVVTKKKGEPIWRVKDEVKGNVKEKMYQLWHGREAVTNKIKLDGINPNSYYCSIKKGAFSVFYGEKEVSSTMQVAFDKEVTTVIDLK